MKLTEDQIVLIVDAVAARAATYPAELFNEWYDQTPEWRGERHAPDKTWYLQHG